MWTIGTLNDGAIATITLTGTVDVGEGGNIITNMTTAATGDQPDPSTVGDDLVESVTVNDAADLVTIKTLASGDATPAEGDTVTFQIEVTNNGAAQATNVSLIDELPTWDHLYDRYHFSRDLRCGHRSVDHRHAQ